MGTIVMGRRESERTGKMTEDEDEEWEEGGGEVERGGLRREDDRGRGRRVGIRGKRSGNRKIGKRKEEEECEHDIRRGENVEGRRKRIMNRRAGKGRKETEWELKGGKVTKGREVVEKEEGEE